MVKENPNVYWYVYGTLYNRLLFTMPHSGYSDLKEIAQKFKDEKSFYIFHEGIDNLWQKSGFSREVICQPKGNLFRWQCFQCLKIHSYTNYYAFENDMVKGLATNTPGCKKCDGAIRPNIQLKNDLEFVETDVNL